MQYLIGVDYDDTNESKAGRAVLPQARYGQFVDEDYHWSWMLDVGGGQFAPLLYLSSI